MKTIFNKWPALLLFTAGLIGVAIFFKSYDFLLINELKAILSVVFGFASSFILLSLIWLLQRKPINESWPSSSVMTRSTDSPNMHPRGSLESLGSLAESRSRFGTIKSVFPAKDKPPNYEDALIYSKPVIWNDSFEKRFLNEDFILSTTSVPNDSIMFSPSMHVNESVNASQPIHLVTSKDCSICTNPMISLSQNNYYQQNLNKDNHRNQTGNTMAQLALNIVRGFTSFENSSQYQQVSLETTVNTVESERQRKASFCQLDVNQLMMLSSSPPKYCDLNFGREPLCEENNSNEARAGRNNN